MIRQTERQTDNTPTHLLEEAGDRRISGGGGGEEVGVGVRLSSRRVSREGARRESKGEAPHAPLSRRRELGVGGAWARLSSTGVWMPTERVLTGDLRRGVGVEEGVGVPGVVSCDEAEVRSPRRERRRGNGDNAN